MIEIDDAPDLVDPIVIAAFEGWNDAAETFNVTLELVRRGYTEQQIGMLWSGNLLRVLDEVQAVAAEIQAGS